MLFGQFDGPVSAVGQQNVVIVLEDDAQGLARAFLVVHNQQGAFGIHDLVRGAFSPDGRVQMDCGGHT